MVTSKAFWIVERMYSFIFSKTFKSYLKRTINSNDDTIKRAKISHLHINEMRSAALPEPSQTTTGTGGSSVTYSKTALIVLVPPSMTRQTIGIGL